MKPLLEDSTQIESDSQRDSNKYIAQNNNADTDKNVPCAKDIQVSPCHKDIRNINVGFKPPRSSILQDKSKYTQNRCCKRKTQKDRRLNLESRKKRIATAKERRAFIVLGIIMATFINSLLVPIFLCILIVILVWISCAISVFCNILLGRILQFSFKSNNLHNI